MLSKVYVARRPALANPRPQTPIDRPPAARAAPLSLASATRSGILAPADRSRFVNSSANPRLRQNRARMSAGALAFLALIAFGASGCGRRGALEPPPDPNAVAAKEVNGDTHPQVAHKPKPVQPPKQPFFLDFLL
jgi:predicted small lipoprotein YifL